MRSSTSKSSGAAASMRVARAVAIVGAAVGLAIPLAGTAHATGARDGHCDDGEFCLFYYPVGVSGGAVSDFAVGNIPNLGPTQPTCYEFRGSGTGSGQCVWQNARSARNRTGHNVRVFTNVNYTSTSDLFTANGTQGDLYQAKFLDESIKFVT
ncbi:peptidase inhibitor family I36 protein [Amycolatopsis mongoliensis]|uniref:Peptidase inhibitor family I36 protein n=1 Tax=Amycolatopsis mongoliensis TaxID=715475 RepID=A0A9Y2JHD2_9PSEU|nr:peptidase inhibitor family I36 protein [Amycolatopsis sp. 4-36]WIX98660.1 peptidase inhibitor family I36 protein [Amycolatopsis sp. 4-36]